MELDEKTVGHPVSLDQKSLYRVGGIAAILLAIAYVVIVPLYAEVGAPPSGGHAWFKYLSCFFTLFCSRLIAANMRIGPPGEIYLTPKTRTRRTAKDK
jgi:hypothetical protein